MTPDRRLAIALSIDEPLRRTASSGSMTASSVAHWRVICSRPFMRQIRASSPPIAAIVNSNDDLVAVLKDTLEREGFAVVTAHTRDFRSGRESFTAFLGTYNPSVVIYDIA